MRVISGEVGGFRLKGPPSRATRPMTDKIKSALFSMLSSLGAEPVRVLDLYAGTGSLGIEALSRWADHAEFVEQSAAAAAVIRANLAHTRYTDVANVHVMSVSAFLLRHRAQEPFDLVMLDPPYADAGILEMLTALGESTLIQSGTLVVLGHWPRLAVPERLGRLRLIRNRCHGDSCFSVFDAVAADTVADETEPSQESPP